MAVVILSWLPPALAAELTVPERTEIEELLGRLGFIPGAVDGVIDEDTRAAIARYKDFAALLGDSAPDRALLIELRAVFQAVTDSRQAGGEETKAPSALGDDGSRSELPRAEIPAAASGDGQQAAELPPPADQDMALPDPVTDEIEAPSEAETPQPAALGPVERALLPHRTALASGQTTKAQLAREFNAKGQEFFAQARYVEAIAQYTVALALDPKFAAAYHNRGVAYEGTGRRDRATRDFEKAFSLGFARLKAASP